jgi:hypothetical protein
MRHCRCSLIWRLKKLKLKHKSYKIADRDGMYAFVANTGQVTFRYDYRLNGRRETLTIGRYGDDGMTLFIARERCAAARKMVAEGESPALEKQRARRRQLIEHSFGAIGQLWLKDATWQTARVQCGNRFLIVIFCHSGNSAF